MLILTEAEPAAEDPTRRPCDDTVPPSGDRWAPAALDRLLTALDLHCDHADRRAS
jgi:hypothetical protein